MRVSKGGPPKSPERRAVIGAIAALDGKEATYQDIADVTGLTAKIVMRHINREQAQGAGLHIENRRRKGRLRPAINPTDEMDDHYPKHLSYRAKVPLEIVTKVDELRVAGFTVPRIAYAMQCSKSCIEDVLRRKGVYAQIPKQRRAG